MIVGDQVFHTENQGYLMGILNVTPDSFSDGGKYNCMDRALEKTEKMLKEGADIIDVGGESTRPGYTKVSVLEEVERTAPVIEKIKQEFDPVISLDTWKADVAKAGIDAGAHMINDIWGLQGDQGMAGVIAGSHVSACFMHNREHPCYHDLVLDVYHDLECILKKALDAGISGDRIMLDPGIGFAKTYQDNLQIMNHLEKFCQLGVPLLLGTSRKSMIGKALDLSVEERLEGTLATTAVGYMKGCRFFRVHDIKENKRVLQMTQAICNGKESLCQTK